MDSGQARAFEGFVSESGDALLRMATLLTSDPDTAEDVYQETLQRLAMRWSRVGNPRAFCRRVLHNPLVGPALRSALYKVLAETPGVQVRTGTRDSLGRPAVEISRYENGVSVNEETFEDPRTGAVLETAFVYRGDTPEGTDVYLSVTGHPNLPPDPYGG